MTAKLALELFGEGFFLVVLMVSVLILPSLLVGLIVSVFQAATQINEQTLSFLPRLLTILLTLLITGGWLMQRLLEYTARLINSIPLIVG